MQVRELSPVQGRGRDIKQRPHQGRQFNHPVARISRTGPDTEPTAARDERCCVKERGFPHRGVPRDQALRANAGAGPVELLAQRGHLGVSAAERHRHAHHSHVTDPYQHSPLPKQQGARGTPGSYWSAQAEGDYAVLRRVKRGVSTTATKTADGWRLSGTKLRISHAQIADGVMVAARIVDGDRKDGRLFLLDLPNHHRHVKPIPTMGMDATEVCKARFDNCLLAPEAEATRHVEGGLRSALHLVEQARLRVVFMAIGIAQASLELAVSFAKERTQFGRPIASFQLIQGLLAQMATGMEAARLLGYQAASQMMDGRSARE